MLIDAVKGVLKLPNMRAGSGLFVIRRDGRCAHRTQFLAVSIGPQASVSSPHRTPDLRPHDVPSVGEAQRRVWRRLQGIGCMAL